MSALTKQLLVDNLVDMGIANQRQASDLVVDFFEEIKLALEAGEEVKLSTFGSFRTADKTPRPGRNPKTGEEVTVEARRVVTFAASPLLKERVIAGMPDNS